MTEERVRRAIIASLLCATFALVGCRNSENLRTAPPPPPITADNPLTVMSFNIRQGKGPDGSGGFLNDLISNYWMKNLDAVVDAIRSVDPDIIGIQEVANLGQARKLAHTLNMNYAFVAHDPGNILGIPRPEWWGVAILSKFPIFKFQRIQLFVSANRNTRNAIQVTVDIGGHSMTFFNIHKDKRVNNGRAISKILDAVEVNEDKIPVVLIGDFNIRSSDPRLDSIKERFFDTAILANSENARKVRELGTFHKRSKRIDYIFAEIEHFLVNDVGLVAKIHRRASDHYAYFAKLTLKR